MSYHFYLCTTPSRKARFSGIEFAGVTFWSVPIISLLFTPPPPLLISFFPVPPWGERQCSACCVCCSTKPQSCISFPSFILPDKQPCPKYLLSLFTKSMSFSLAFISCLCSFCVPLVSVHCVFFPPRLICGECIKSVIHESSLGLVAGEIPPVTLCD